MIVGIDKIFSADELTVVETAGTGFSVE